MKEVYIPSINNRNQLQNNQGLKQHNKKRKRQKNHKKIYEKRTENK